MKLKNNRFAIVPVLCHSCKRYIWLEPYRRGSVFLFLADRYMDQNICNECIKKYDVGVKNGTGKDGCRN